MSDYSTLGNSPICYNDVKGDCPWCVSAIEGFVVGFALDVGLQMLANATVGKDIWDIYYGDAFVSGTMGALTGGLGATTKLVKVAELFPKVLKAAGINGKVANATLKTSAVFTEEGIKASFDMKVSSEKGEFVEFKSVFFEGNETKGVFRFENKSKDEAAVDFVAGTILTVFKEGSKTVSKQFLTKELEQSQQNQKALVRKLRHSMTGSGKSIDIQGEIMQTQKEIETTVKVIERSGDVVTGFNQEKAKQKVRDVMP